MMQDLHFTFPSTQQARTFLQGMENRDRADITIVDHGRRVLTPALYGEPRNRNGTEVSPLIQPATFEESHRISVRVRGEFLSKLVAGLPFLDTERVGGFAGGAIAASGDVDGLYIFNQIRGLIGMEGVFVGLDGTAIVVERDENQLLSVKVLDPQDADEQTQNVIELIRPSKADWDAWRQEMMDPENYTFGQLLSGLPTNKGPTFAMLTGLMLRARNDRRGRSFPEIRRLWDAIAIAADIRPSTRTYWANRARHYNLPEAFAAVIEGGES